MKQPSNFPSSSGLDSTMFTNALGFSPLGDASGMSPNFKKAFAMN